MKDLIEKLREEGFKNFGSIKPEDDFLNGKLFGENDLLSYCKYIIPEYKTPKHIQLIADHLTKVEKGEIKRLIINMPPRHGKSQLTSMLFPTWYLGKNPSSQIIISSYAATLAEKFTRWQRNTCESDIYKTIFKNFSTRQDSRAKDEWETMNGGVVIGAGVDGPITGRGADLAIIDDPSKNYEEAMSEILQDKIWEWYRSTLYTRLHPDAKLILVMTRWNTNDLAGKLLKEQGTVSEGGKWHILKLPAISELNEPLWGERYSLEDYYEMRMNSGDKIFSALYQQEPVDIKERLFLDPKFEESPKNLKTFAYLDPAFGGNDFTAITVGCYEYKNDEVKIWILAGEIWKTTIDETYKKVVSICNLYNVSTLYCESNQAQVVIANELRKKGLFVKDINNKINKHLRIVNSVRGNWSRLHFSNSISRDYMKQILEYSEHSRFDDAPDSLSGLLDQFKQQNTNITKRFSFLDFLS